MNKKTALIKSLLKGDVINVLNSIKLTGYSNYTNKKRKCRPIWQLCYVV